MKKKILNIDRKKKETHVHRTKNKNDGRIIDKIQVRNKDQKKW